MLIDGPDGTTMEEFICGEYTHRYVVDTQQSYAQRESRKKYEWWKFEKYINEHETVVSPLFA